MNKTKFKYVKYTKLELDRYVRDEKSCIKRKNSEIHIGFPPWGFANFEETLTNIISRDKIGKYDAKLDGIVLEVRNIKVLGTAYAVHNDDPYNHMNIRANFYVFQPRTGSIIKGVVKHVSHGHVAVIIYRVFNVSIRFDRSEMRDSLNVDRKISFRIKKFELQGAMPYIEGELIDIDVKTENLNKHLTFENDDDNENDADNGGDSGISTEGTHQLNYKKEENGTDSSSSSGSDSESTTDSESEQSNEELANELFPNIRIKREKLSDSEESSKLNIAFGLGKIKSERKDTSDESESDESTSSSDSEIGIKQEKHGSANVDQPLLHSIKKEKEESKQTAASTTFIPRPIKTEPQSDTEGMSKFKTPTSEHRLNESYTFIKSQKNHRNSKTSNEHFGSPANQSLLNVSVLETPIMSSTLKIKQEIMSEDESIKRKKRKTTTNDKSLKLIESDIFDSFLE